MGSKVSANKTSARLLVDFARQRWGADAEDSSSESQRLCLMVCDLYIKARSYAVINKTAFWLAIMAGVAVLVWPSIAVIAKDFGVEKELLQSAVVQTTVTGIAALTFAVYGHYKKRQVQVENLMRHVVYSGEPQEVLIPKVLEEMERLDAGFSFAGASRDLEDADAR